MSKPSEPQPPVRKLPPPVRPRKSDVPVIVKKRPRVSTRTRLRKLRATPTIGGMRTQLSHVLRIGLWAFVLIFLITGIWSFGMPGQAQDGAEAEQAKLPDPIITVGSAKLPQARWQQIADSMRLNDPTMLTMRYGQEGSIADAWIRQQIEIEEAKKRGVGVSRAELNADIESKIDQALEAERAGADEREWRYRVQKQAGGMDKKRADLRERIAADPDAVRDQLLVEKLRKAVQNEVKLTDAQYAEELDEVGGRVILLRTGAVKPSPPGEGQTESAAEKTQREAGEKAWREGLDKRKAEAQKLLAQLKAAPATFAAVAKDKSEDFGTKEQGGELTQTNREGTRFGDDFKKKAFATPVGQISELIEGDEGWIIFKTEKQKKFPADFMKADPRTFEAAEKIAKGLVDQLKAKPDTFAAVAKAKSEDPGSGEKGGDLGEIRRGMMVKAFEKMAFAMPQDEISPPFRSQFGVHILQVTERTLPKAGETVPQDEDPKPDPEDKRAVAEAEALKKLPLPKSPAAPAMAVKARHILLKAADPQQQVDDAKQQVLDRKQSEHYEDVIRQARAAAQAAGRIQIHDPMLRGWFAASQGDYADELRNLRETTGTWPSIRPEAQLELAKKLEQAGMTQAMGPDAEKDQLAAIAALGKDPDAVPGLIEASESFLPAVRVAIANALGDLKAQAAVSRLTMMVVNDQDETVANAAKAALQKIGAPVPERKISAKSPSLTPDSAAPPAPPTTITLPVPTGPPATPTP